jgi:hypothetical protein
MKVSRFFFVAIALSIVLPFVNAQAAKPKPKPAAATGPATPMPGSGGKIGTPYKLGNKGDELHFTLEKAEFATRFMIESDTVMTDPKHRMLVITFAAQNPAKVDRAFSERAFKFTVVSPDDENFVVSVPIVHPDRRTPMNIQLKPAQKVRGIAYVPIHPKGPVNKLIIQRGDKTPVLRYDLHDLVKPLSNVYAADKGVSTIDPGIGVMKVPFELGPFDYTVDSVEEMPRLNDWNPGDGQKVIVIRMLLKDVSMVQYWATASFLPKLIDDDGNELRFVETLKNSSDEHLHTNPAPGDELKFRLVFYAPANAKLQKLVLYSQLSGRSVMIPILPIPATK